MTGYGSVRTADGPLHLHVEVRSVNNRYLKFVARMPEAYAEFENDVEAIVRKTIKRGTITLTVDRVNEESGAEVTFNRDVIAEYVHEWESLREETPSLGPLDAGAMLQLPGVVRERSGAGEVEGSEWDALKSAVEAALEKFQAFRTAEGQSMAADLRANLQIIRSQLGQVSEHAESNVRQYRDRILDRVGELLKESDVELEANDLIREVSVFADKCDINEEIVRLSSHLDHFETYFDSDASEGKRLDFLSQEMNREVNTIGSKANNVAIAHCVVEMKSSVEKIREILQNVE